MQIFLDTADIKAIKAFSSWGIVDGVTTNPSLIAKEGVDLKERICAIAKIVEGPISSEVTATDTDDMIKQGRTMAAWAENICIKIPMTVEGLRAVKILSEEGIMTNVTLVFSVTQALLAAKAGATFVSPFVGRLDDIGNDGIELVSDIVDAFETYGYQTAVLAASIRHMQHVLQAIQVGADVITLPPKLLEQMITHPLTDKGLAAFEADWKSIAHLQKPL